MWRAVNDDAKSSSAARARFIYTASNDRLAVSDLYLVSKRNQMLHDSSGVPCSLVQLEEASTHNSAKTHDGNVPVIRNLVL